MRRKSINILLGIAVFLLLTNIAVEIFTENVDKKNHDDISVALIDSSFHKVLSGYSIDDEHIRKKIVRARLSDSLDYVYDVKLPADIPSPNILRDVKNELNYPAIKLNSVEEKTFGDTRLNIYSNDMLKLSARLSYDDKFVRPYSELSFIIENGWDMSADDFQTLTKIPFPFGIELIPSIENEGRLDAIREYNKEYVILINDEIDDSRFKLSSKLSQGLLRGSVGEIVNAFRGAVYFIVDEKSELYRSAIFNFIRDEFKKRNVQIIPKSQFVSVQTTDPDDMRSLFNFYCESGKSKKGKTILITWEGLNSLNNEIEIAKKKGHKFLLPSLLK